MIKQVPRFQATRPVAITRGTCVQSHADPKDEEACSILIFSTMRQQGQVILVWEMLLDSHAGNTVLIDTTGVKRCLKWAQEEQNSDVNPEE